MDATQQKTLSEDRHIWDRPWFWPMAIYLAAAVVHLGWVAVYGPHLGGDSSRYLKMSADILAGRADVFSIGYLLYGGYAYLLAGIRLVFGPSSLWPPTIIQALVAAWGPVFIYGAVRIVRPQARRVVVAGASFLFGALCFDALLWDAYILTDSLFLVLTTAVFYFLVKGICLGQWRGAVVLSAVVFFYRPGTQILLPLTLLFVGLSWFLRRSSSPGRRLLVVAVAALLVSGALVWSQAYLMKYPPGDGFPLRERLLSYKAKNDKGIVVRDRPETYHRPPRTVADYAGLTLDKYVHMFRFVFATYSAKHKVINWIYFVPYYLLALLGAVVLVRGRAVRDRGLLMLALGWIHVFCLFYSFFTISYGWRYQMVNMPAVWLLAVLGVSYIWERPTNRAA